MLILTQRFPYPPDRGDRIRSYNLIRFLAEHFDITVGCTTHEPIPSENFSYLRGMVSEVMVGKIGKWTKYRRAAQSVSVGASISEGYFYSPELAKSARKLHAIKPFDALLVYCSSMFQYRNLAGLSNVPTVVDLVDVDSQKWRQLSKDSSGFKRQIYRVEAYRTHCLEKRIATVADSITLTSSQEAALFNASLGGKASAIGISNGVDTNYFNTNSSRYARTSKTVELVFTGVMDYPPNVDGIRWFCREVWPLITTTLRANLKIVGRNPTQAVRSLGNIAGVEVVGEVSDIRPFLDAADIAISPLHLARGIQNKVLEAMASGLPSVITPQSAEGIEAVSGVHFAIAEDPQEFSDKVVSLGQSIEMRMRMGAAARELVLQRYSWHARLEKFIELIDQACATRCQKRT